MKKLIFTAVLTALAMTSCSKKESSETEQPKTESNVMMEEPTAKMETAAATTPEEQGKQLVEGADCLSCHKIDAKLVGPSYQDVAAKYTDADIDHLETKIIEGGKGNWGDIPMTPHAGLSQDNAKLMVKYILSLKK